MRLKTTYSPNAVHFSIIKDFRAKGKKSTRVVENLGNLEQVKQRAGDQDYQEWLKDYIEYLRQLDKEENGIVTLNLNPNKEIDKDNQVAFNGGYLFLQSIYYSLGLHKICKTITDKYKFTYDLNDVLSRLIYARVIYPASKLSTMRLSGKFIEQPKFKLHHIYRALAVIAAEKDFIQAELYKNSLKLAKRNDGILYYDCTNYFFEIEEESGMKKYAKSKDDKPNPLVQMGLFMDGDGIPLAFNITPGNTNEQITLQPLEKQIIKDFKLSKFIVCTDAGLASTANRKFNNVDNRAFITTQSIKKLKKFLMDWALSPHGWSLSGSNKLYDISKLDENEEQQYSDRVFFKERWINENGLEQRLIITYSLKYRNYQRQIRKGQIERAQKLIDTNPKKIGKVNQNDYRRFVSKISFTQDGEVAEETVYKLDQNLIDQEGKFDGYYGLCTDLEDSVEDIVAINHRRWEVEESFKIMKSEFRARPAYLQRDDKITAHFTTCVLALIIYRYLEKIVNETMTVSKIIDCLRNYNFHEVYGLGYLPHYTKTDSIDLLHEKFGFKTDFEIVSLKKMNKILRQTKSSKTYGI